ncbi:hypothetical protein AK830_g12336 [Neonectria ditissima]|uniref:Glucose-repressible alcohol dehydrogenase transcriptional effector n=1 Tax=Neonectria ditissima TaxID=78410 RepID=A0A0N8H4T1_9HYPO|nr:hypothetical protein AK830_g12336 [Neonectria ditissima]
MSEEPTLPPLPAVSWDEQSQSFSNNPRKRVRLHPSHAPTLNHSSSDPAVFSSDDDPALDNYVEGRRKKRYVGSWFQQHPTSSDSTFGETIQVPKHRRAWTRQADSGVYLGSDGNESDDLMDHVEAIPKPRLPHLDRAAVAVRRVSEAEQTARNNVQSCLERGDETVDFWSMGLTEVSNDTISPLSQFSCIPVVTKDVAFEQKDPELKIYFAMNRLTRVPGAIFDITYLTILSLRGNKLTELPPAISKLHNLKELNVSQNRLRHLPVELLGLLDSGSSLRTLVLHPNPFWQPESDLQAENPSEGDVQPAGTILYQYEDGLEDLETPHLVTRSLGRSPVQLSNTSGRVSSDFRLPSGPASRFLPVESSANGSPQTPSRGATDLRRNLAGASVVPSLLESALRTCYLSAQLPEMGFYIPDGLSHLRELLERAMRQKEAGGLTCSRCCRLIVVPTVEWVEWHEIRTCERLVQDGPVHMRAIPLSMAEGETAVPFIHRGCSSRCGPTRMGRGRWGVPGGYPAPIVVEESGPQS